jgi:hypothetical protein
MGVRSLLPLLLLLALASASIQLVVPVNTVLEDLGTVSVSPVGPGHEVFLKFERSVSPCPTGYCGVWDSVRIINDVAERFTTSTWSDDEFIYYSVKVPSTMPSGEYTFMFEVSDKEALMGSETAVVKVFVTHDQSELVGIVPYSGEFGGFAGETNYASFSIHNKALSKASYKVTSEMPGYQSYSTTITVDVGPAETKEARVPYSLDQEGFYTLKSRVWSEDNPTIDLRTSTEVKLKPTLSSKFKSIGAGLPLIPLTMAPFYALLGLLGW